MDLIAVDRYSSLLAKPRKPVLNSTESEPTYKMVAALHMICRVCLEARPLLQ